MLFYGSPLLPKRKLLILNPTAWPTFPNLSGWLLSNVALQEAAPLFSSFFSSLNPKPSLESEGCNKLLVVSCGETVASSRY